MAGERRQEQGHQHEGKTMNGQKHEPVPSRDASLSNQSAAGPTCYATLHTGFGSEPAGYVMHHAPGCKCPPSSPAADAPRETLTLGYPMLERLSTAWFDGDGMHYFTAHHARELRSLLAHVSTGEQDTERLDWLISLDTEIEAGPHLGWHPQHSSPETLREAIDRNRAARATLSEPPT